MTVISVMAMSKLEDIINALLLNQLCQLACRTLGHPYELSDQFPLLVDLDGPNKSHIYIPRQKRAPYEECLSLCFSLWISQQSSGSATNARTCATPGFCAACCLMLVTGATGVPIPWLIGLTEAKDELLFGSVAAALRLACQLPACLTNLFAKCLRTKLACGPSACGYCVYCVPNCVHHVANASIWRADSAFREKLIYLRISQNS